MPYMHVFGNEEMKKKRERISVLNQNGSGLKNKDIALSLAELQSFMERARTAMQEEYGRDKTGREILLYLDKAGKAFEQLLTGKVRKAEGEQAPDAPAPDALEDALHILSGFKEQMLTRYGDEGKMVLDTIAQKGGKDGFGKAELLGALDSLDYVLDVNLAGIGDEAKELDTPENKENYLKKKPLLDFRNDPNARMIAQIVSGANDDLRERFLDAVQWSYPPDMHPRTKDILKNLGAKVSAQVDAAHKTDDPVKRRALMMQATTGFKLIRSLLPNGLFNYLNKDHPNYEKANFPQPRDMEKLVAGDELLKDLFDENDPKALEQTFALGALPKGELKLPAAEISDEKDPNKKVTVAATPRMVFAHLAAPDDQDENQYGKHARNADRELLNITVLSMKSQLDNIKDKTLKDELGKIYHSMETIHTLAKDLYGDRVKDRYRRYWKHYYDYDEAKKIAEDGTKATEDLIRDVNEFRKKYPQYEGVLSRTAGPFLFRLDKMDLKVQGGRAYNFDEASAKTEPHKKEIERYKKIEPLIKPDYEKNVAKKEEDPRYYSNTDMKAAQREAEKEFFVQFALDTGNLDDQAPEDYENEPKQHYNGELDRFFQYGARDFEGAAKWSDAELTSEAIKNHKDPDAATQNKPTDYLNVTEHALNVSQYFHRTKVGTIFGDPVTEIKEIAEDTQKTEAEKKEAMREVSRDVKANTLRVMRKTAALLDMLVKETGNSWQKYIRVDNPRFNKFALVSYYKRLEVEKIPDIVKDLNERIEKGIQKTVQNAKDPLKTYIALHSGHNVPSDQQRSYSDTEGMFIEKSNCKLEALSRVAAAYKWKAEHPDYQPGQGIPFPIDEINESAKKILAEDKVFFNLTHTKMQFGSKVVDVVDDVAVQNLLLSPKQLAKPYVEPESYGLSAEEQIEALKKLRELGDVMDSCRGALDKYKNFYFGLKDLGLKDIESMSPRERGEELNKILNLTEQAMQGRMTRCFSRVKNEQFEQALDALAILRNAGSPSPFEKRVDSLVKQTNDLRTNRIWIFKQQPVSLEGRSLENTAKRLARMRKVERSKQSDNVIALTEKQLGKATRADAVLNAAPDAAKLPKPPKDMGRQGWLDLSELKGKITEFYNLKGDNLNASARRVPEMLALTITAAYKSEDGKIIVDKQLYERNVRVMQQHLASEPLVSDYAKEQKREELKNAPNGCKKLRQEFDAKSAEINRTIDDQEKKEQGDIYGMSDEQVRDMLNKRHEDLKKEKAERRKELHEQVKSGTRENDAKIDKREETTLNKLKEELFGSETDSTERAKEAGDRPAKAENDKEKQPEPQAEKPDKMNEIKKTRAKIKQITEDIKNAETFGKTFGM